MQTAEGVLINVGNVTVSVNNKGGNCITSTTGSGFFTHPSTYGDDMTHYSLPQITNGPSYVPYEGDFSYSNQNCPEGYFNEKNYNIFRTAFETAKNNNNKFTKTEDFVQQNYGDYAAMYNCKVNDNVFDNYSGHNYGPYNYNDQRCYRNFYNRNPMVNAQI